MNLLHSLFGGMLSAVWQTAKEYHYGTKAPGHAHEADAHEAQEGHAAQGDAAEDAQARKVTPEHVVMVLSVALPIMRVGYDLRLHHADCIYPHGCDCIPAITGPLVRC